MGVETDEETRLKCLSASACLGPSPTDLNSTEGCAPHHRGPLCAACAPASYRATGAYNCVPCNDNEGVSAIFVLLLLLGVLAVISAVTKLTPADGGKAAAVDVVVAKITMNHFVIALLLRHFHCTGLPFSRSSCPSCLSCRRRPWATRPSPLTVLRAAEARAPFNHGRWSPFSHPPCLWELLLHCGSYSNTRSTFG